jgi:hypothetical protein
MQQKWAEDADSERSHMHTAALWCRLHGVGYMWRCLSTLRFAGCRVHLHSAGRRHAGYRGDRQPWWRCD